MLFNFYLPLNLLLLSRLNELILFINILLILFNLIFKITDLLKEGGLFGYHCVNIDASIWTSAIILVLLILFFFLNWCLSLKLLLTLLLKALLFLIFNHLLLHRTGSLLVSFKSILSHLMDHTFNNILLVIDDDVIVVLAG